MVNNRLKNFVTRFKKTKTTLGCMGDMMLSMDVQWANIEELSYAIEQVTKSRMSYEHKREALAFIEKYRTKLSIAQ